MNQESGRSMIEMLGVLAIMGALTFGAYKMIASGLTTQKVSAVADDVMMMVTNVRSIYSEYDTFASLDGSTIFRAMNMSGENPYGGTYELTANPSNPRQFVVTINGLGQSECAALLAKAWTDSIGYQMSGGVESGATGNCNGENGTNSVQIIYAE